MLTKKIREEIKTAMKARDQLRLDTLRGAITAFTNELVAKGRKPTGELTDAEAQAVLKRLVKQRKDAAQQYTAGGRPELAEKEMTESKILEGYLPTAASKEDIEKVARAKMTELGIADAKGAGKLMGAVMKEFAGSADGNDVKEVVNSLLI